MLLEKLAKEVKRRSAKVASNKVTPVDYKPPRPTYTSTAASVFDVEHHSSATWHWSASPGPFAELVDGMDRLQLQLCSQVRAGLDGLGGVLRARRMDALRVHPGRPVCLLP